MDRKPSQLRKAARPAQYPVSLKVMERLLLGNAIQVRATAAPATAVEVGYCAFDTLAGHIA